MEIVKQVLREAKISKSYKGYFYLATAVKMVMEDEERLCHIREEIYQKVADTYNVNITKVEKDIRTIRDVFWRENGAEFMRRITGVEYDNKPYPRELIEVLADYSLKRESRQAKGEAAEPAETEENVESPAQAQA